MWIDTPRWNRLLHRPRAKRAGGRAVCRGDAQRAVVSLAAGIILAIAARPAAGATPQTAPATQPVAAPPTYLDLGRQSEHDFQDEYNSMPPVATLRRDTIARVFIDNDRLAVEIGGFEAPQLSRVNVSDSDGMWLVLQKFFRMRGARPRPMLLLDRYDFDQKNPDAIWGTHLNVNMRVINLSGESLQRHIVFAQYANHATLTVNENNPDAPVESAHLSFQGATLVEIRNRHPAEYRSFLLPLLAKLTDPSSLLPGPTDLYEVFNDIPADPAASRQITDLLPALDSAVPEERAGALTQIDAMGSSGILAAIRMDASTLTPEQQSALSDVIERGRHTKIPDIATARHDLSFLIDCLEVDAPGIRPAAVQEISKLLGRKIRFDSTLHGPAALAAADAARLEILGSSPETPISE